MYEFILILSFIFFIVILSYIAKRMLENISNEIINPLFYYLIFSLLYYIVGGWSSEYSQGLLNLKISRESLNIARIYSLYYILVIFIFYFLSKKKDNIYYTFHYSRLIMLFFVFSIFSSFLISSLVLFKNGPYFYYLSLSSHRVYLQEVYVNITQKYYLGPQLIIGLTFCSLLTLKYKKGIYSFICMLPICLIQMTVHSRTYISTFLIALIITLILKRPEQFKKYIFVLALSMFCMLLFTYKGSNNWEHDFYAITAEFSHTYLTIPLLVQHNEYIGYGDILYYVNDILKFISLRQDIPYLSESLQHISQTYISLGSNNISESLYYGGYIGLLLSPVITSIIYMIIYKKNKHGIYSFVFLFMVCIYMRTSVRGVFFGSVYSLLSYFLIISVIIFLLKGMNKK